MPVPALAVADKPLVRQMFAAKQLNIDYLETSGPLVESAAAEFGAPLLLHNSLWDWSLAHPTALDQHNALTTTRHTLAITQAPWFSVHLGFSAADVAFDHGMQARSPVCSRRDAFEAICRNIRLLADSIAVPLIIENLDYNPGGAYEYICEPDFIAEVLRETKVGLLLDLAHARVSAARLGYTIAAYLDHLPLERVMQIHVSGPRWIDGLLVDVHDTLLDEDYDLLSRTLAHTAPKALTLEYARDAQGLLTQIDQLRAVLNSRAG